VLGKTAQFRRRLLNWYRQNRRDLPWRTASGCPDAYHVLVSELMLQQTQVATVIPYFHRFLAAFPTLATLAEASESQVLRLWQGLGYYRRARHLHLAAQAVVSQHGGRLPDNVATLMTLPGIGRYTAGAIASLAYGRQAPILDGNVVRVLCRPFLWLVSI
jgi:A/G-specific adenine glycosylase